MTTDHLNPAQFRQPGDDEAKAALIAQLRENFKKKDLKWLKDDSIRVDAPKRIDPNSVEMDDYPDWRASKQLKAVHKCAKKIDKGQNKPVPVAEKPDGTREVIDGHHHFLGYIDAKKKPKAFIVHVPAQNGPWSTLHDQQTNDDKKDDFGKTSSYDRND
jgi:hypothetical protein